MAWSGNRGELSHRLVLARRARDVALVLSRCPSLPRSRHVLEGTRTGDESPTASASASAGLEGGDGGVGAGSDVRIGGVSVEQKGGFEAGHALEESAEVGGVCLKSICCLARDADFVFAAEFETGCVVCDVCEEGEKTGGRGAVLDETGEGVHLGGDGGHGGGEDGVELAEVCKVAGEVERERVEGVGVLGEQGQGVCGCTGIMACSHRGHGRGRGGTT